MCSDYSATMLQKVGWMSINQLACEVRLVETWKALNNENYCLRDIFEKIENGPHNTRSSNKIKLKSYFKTRIRESSFQLPSVQLWNAAPVEVRSLKPVLSLRQDQKSENMCSRPSQSKRLISVLKQLMISPYTH